jgi:diaminopimelate epimerase
VSFYCALQAGAPARIRARIFERGVGETLSSGTGASGAAIAYLLDASTSGRVVVVLDGGELDVDVASDLRVALSGWAVPVFAGQLSDQLLDQLRRLD